MSQDRGNKSRSPFVLQTTTQSQAYADDTTYYIASVQSTTPVVGQIVPYDSVLKRGYFFIRNSVNGTSESVAFSILVQNDNATKEYPLTSTYSMTASGVVTLNDNIPVKRGDRVSLKMVCPTWATNPTAVVISSLYFEPSPLGNGPIVLNNCTANISPADATTYYCGHGILSTTAASVRIYIPRNGYIRRVYANVRNSTNGTTEAVQYYVRVNNATDYLISDTVTLNTTNVDFGNLSMQVPVNAGDYIEIKMVCPTWATNPTTVVHKFYIVIDPQ